MRSGAVELEGFLGHGGGLLAAFCLMAGGTGPLGLARMLDVDVKALRQCLNGERPNLHVRRALEQQFGLPLYYLDERLRPVPEPTGRNHDGADGEVGS